MADLGAVKQEEQSGNEQDEQVEQRSSSSPRNEHDGKIVTSEHSNEPGRDDCSDLTDHHAEEEETPKSFPQKLMDILNNEEYSSIISWLPTGNGFVIHKKKTFANEIIPRHFKATQFTSFTRKLNRWGFSRAPRGPDVGAYFHKHFQRDKPELCLQMMSSSGAKAHDAPPPVGPANPAVMMMPGSGMPYFMPNPQMMMQMSPMQQQQAMWQAQYMQQMQQMQMMAFHQQQQAAAAAAAAAPQGVAGFPMHSAASSGFPMQMGPLPGHNPPMIPNNNNMMMMPQQPAQQPPGDPFPSPPPPQPQSAIETSAVEGTTAAASLEEDVVNKEEEPTEDAASEVGGEEVAEFDGADVDFDPVEETEDV